MKWLSFFLILIFFPAIKAQDKNVMITDSVSGKPMLIGHCDRDAFKDSSFSWWFKSGYNLYSVDTTLMQNVKNDLKNVDITIVMGTWCSDSRREVPRLFRILDDINYPMDKVNIITVDRDKNGLENETDSLNIELVPTIIFYKNGEELGRIVETPKDTLEKDIAAIVESKQ